MKVIDFIICDDIRQEVGNKLTVVGIYNDRVKIETKYPSALQFPIPFRLGVFVRLLVEQDDDCGDELAFALDVKHNGEDLFSADCTAQIANRPQGNGRVIVSVPLLANIIPIKGAGKMEFNLSVNSGGKVIFRYQPEYDFEIEVVQK